MQVTLFTQQACDHVRRCHVDRRLASKVRLRHIGATPQQQLHQLDITSHHIQPRSSYTKHTIHEVRTPIPNRDNGSGLQLIPVLNGSQSAVTEAVNSAQAACRYFLPGCASTLVISASPENLSVPALIPGHCPVVVPAVMTITLAT